MLREISVNRAGQQHVGDAKSLQNDDKLQGEHFSVSTVSVVTYQKNLYYTIQYNHV